MMMGSPLIAQEIRPPGKSGRFGNGRRIQSTADRVFRANDRF